MKKYILGAGIIACAAFLLQACDSDTKSKTESIQSMDAKNLKDSAVDNMQHGHMNHGDNMNMETTVTGDFDFDFATLMAAHHQTAVNMAKEVLLNASEPATKAIAKNIIAAQTAEIEKFKSILKDYKKTETKTTAESNKLMEAIATMNSNMKSVTMIGNPDKDFFAMMIPHHESAVTMAKDELTYGNNEALKGMAQKIVEDQTKEIKQFKEILAKK